MSIFLYGNYGVLSANAALTRASAEVSNSAARLASGQRVISGKSGGGDVASADSIKAGAFADASAARNATYKLGIRTTDAAILDTIASLMIQGAELEKASAESGADAAAFNAQREKLVASINNITADVISVGVAAATSGTFTTQLTTLNAQRGTVAGEAMGFELEAAAKQISANGQRDLAQNYLSVDFGAEAASLARYQILQQTATAMLAQASQSSNVILALFK